MVVDVDVLNIRPAIHEHIAVLDYAVEHAGPIEPSTPIVGAWFADLDSQ